MRRVSGWRASRSAAAALVALAALLAACPSQRSQSPAASPEPTPRRTGGSLTVAYPHEPPTLNPFAPAGIGPPTRDLARLLMPGLYRLGPGGARERWLLAAEPTVDPGPPFSVTLELRRDAVWSDGRPITTADLRFTWRAIVGRGAAVASRYGYDRVRDVQALTPRRARLVFDAPFPRWRDLFSAGLGVVPAHALAGDGLSQLDRAWPVSGGGFVLRSWTPGLRMVFERNPRAWFAEPAVDRLTVLFVPDTLTALRLLERRRVRALVAYQGIDFSRRAAEIGGAGVTHDVGSTWAGLWLNTAAPPLEQAAVRRALALSLDGDRIAVALVRAEGEALSAVPPFDGPWYRRNPDRARALLEEAGWEGSGTPTRRGRSLRFTLASVGDGLPLAVVRAIQLQAQEVGFRVEPVPLEPGRFWGTWLFSERFQAAIVVVRDPPGGAPAARFSDGAAANLSRLRDGALARALAAAEGDGGGNSDAARRLAALAPVIPLYRVRVAIAARGARGMRASAAADGPFWNAESWSLG